jgi:hypothetical protein
MKINSKKGDKRAPYIGVCDVYDPEEARVMVDELRGYRTNPSRKLMVGVMAHPLSLDPNKGQGIPECDDVRKVFPVRTSLASAFSDEPDVLNTIHYADLYGPNAGKNLYDNLKSCVQYGGKNLHAIQLDVAWPDIHELARFKQNHSLDIVLQVGSKAMEKADYDPRRVVEKLREYGESINYALFDLSMGKGKLMEANKMLPFLREVQRDLPHLNLSVAGGLGPESARELLEPIAREFPDISIDAQGNLKRKDTPKDALGHLVSIYAADLDRSLGYIRKSCAVLDRRQ